MHRDTFQFTAGPLIGRTIRVELIEMQKPLINRKTSTPMAENSVDRIERRPLDPPPVVKLRLFEIENEGAAGERVTEMEASSHHAYNGFVCHVDLFPIKEPAGFKGPKPMKQWSDGIVIEWPRPEHRHANPTDAAEYEQLKNRISQDEAEIDQKKCTDKLFGCTVVNAVQIKDLQNHPCSVFVFGDISVRTEGHFVLRYRCFDIYSSISSDKIIPICAEEWSSPFVVVGTKEFPGLTASTPLTRHLSNYGIPVNWRGMGRSQAQINAERGRGRQDVPDDDDGLEPPQSQARSAYGARSPAPHHPDPPLANSSIRRGPIPAPSPLRRPLSPPHVLPPSSLLAGPPSRPSMPGPSHSYGPYESQPSRNHPTQGSSGRPTLPSLTQQVPEVDTRRGPSQVAPPRLFGPPPPPHPSQGGRYASMPPPPRPTYDRWEREAPGAGGKRRMNDEAERRF
ncbi:hypothetical protein CALCODRAFT_17345 [Calocera cornea HHB12733]|uniref:Velvet domain-containing protein n=1 Tax=Calocera cornea HHB12733 TaxID=1353952 RepID=A0A165E7W0_9BASI|nr:hypothetical protein CALCODRAFT_17345 [Calocera cornea HHB12733]